MKALREVGLRRAFRFVVMSLAVWLAGVAPLPPFRKFATSLFGASIGDDTILLPIKFINPDRCGFSGLVIGSECFIGADTMFDLAEKITIGNRVTFGPRVTILTHLNVGYDDHPLQRHFPPSAKPVVIEDDCFIGAGAIIQQGVTVGKGAFVSAGAVVTKDVAPAVLAGGVPAKVIKNLG